MNFSKKRLAFLLIVLFSLGVISHSFAISKANNAHIYNGRFASGATNFEEALIAAGYKVNYFSNINDVTKISNSSALIVFPGTDDNAGPLGDFTKEFSALSVNSLRSYVHNGGAILGICGGAYILSKDYQTEFDSGKGLSLVDVESMGYLKDDAATIVDVIWKGKKRSIYYQLGPEFSPSTKLDAQEIATYADGSIAALTIKQGKGLFYLIGPHPEVLASNLEENDIPDGTLKRLSDTSDLLEDMIRDLGKK